MKSKPRFLPLLSLLFLLLAVIEFSSLHSLQALGNRLSDFFVKRYAEELKNYGQTPISPRAAGCPVLLVSYGYNHGQPVREVDADGFIDSLAELPGQT